MDSQVDCPTLVRRALLRIDLNSGTPQDETIVSAWFDYLLQHEAQIDDSDKCQRPEKRLKSSAAELPNYIAN